MTEIAVNNTLSLTQGMSVEISVDVSAEEGRGEFARVSTEDPKSKYANMIKLGEDYVNHVLGFVSEYPDVGSIEPVNTGDLKDTVAVKYTQLQSLPNRIFFITEEGTQHTISIVTIPVHDHSSIYQGGPAYGAYAFDKVVEEPEEE